jgi:hypothetical protein
LTEEEKIETINDVVLRLKTKDYEYYPIFVKKPSKFIKLKEDLIDQLGHTFSNAGLKNLIQDIEYEYVITVVRDSQSDILIAFVTISDKEKKNTPITSFDIFFEKEEKELKSLLNFIQYYHTIFEPHEYNVLMFDGKEKYTDKKFSGIQQKWIIQH